MSIAKKVLTVVAIFFVLAADAKIKGLPQIKNLKDYNINLKGKKVESLKYTVYAANVDGQKVEKGQISDFIAEIFFDNNGNRFKENVYHIETGEIEVKINWTYNPDAGTVIESRVDKKDNLVTRYEYIVNYDLNTVVVRKYENILLQNPPVLKENVLIFDDVWTENSRKKLLKRVNTYYSVVDGIAIKQIISEEDLVKPYTALKLIESLSAPIDYTWLYDYSDKTFKSLNRKTRKENGFNGDWYEYNAKKNLLQSVFHFEKGKILKNESRFEYSFDDQNNWTEIIQYENNKPRFIVQRDIKYKL